MKSKWLRIVTRNVVGVACGLMLGLSVTQATQVFIAQPVKVSGLSMSPTIYDGESMVAIKPLKSKLKRGDIVVLHSPDDYNKLLIKRVIALPGENFKYDGKDLVINDNAYQEEYLKHLNGDFDKVSLDGLIEKKIIKQYETNDKGQKVIPPGYVFVLGDNRRNSHDGDDFGLVRIDDVVAPAFTWDEVKNTASMRNK